MFIELVKGRQGSDGLIKKGGTDLSRQARRGSKSDFFHVIVRGNGKQVLFEEKKDYRFYISILEKYSKETMVTVCAFCLMENHVHLLLNVTKETLAVFMKKMGVCYAAYYNRKYDRTGHLFQDRFLSEAVETEEYLLAAFRYILNNPAAAGICPASEYLWSSYRRYADPMSFIDTAVLERILGNWENYARFIDEDNNDHFMEYSSKKNNEEWAKAVLKKTLDLTSGTIIKSYEKAQRDRALRRLKQEGLTIRQIERLTGIGRSIIQRA